jgi:homoserine dehydrogenase
MTVLGTSGTGFFTHDGYFRQVPIVPEADVPSAFYLRLDVLDAPGVLAQISRVLADQQVSIESVIQRAFDGRAQLVVTTHPAPEGRFFSAVHGIQALGVVAGDPHVLRVIPR